MVLVKDYIKKSQRRIKKELKEISERLKIPVNDLVKVDKESQLIHLGFHEVGITPETNDDYKVVMRVPIVEIGELQIMGSKQFDKAIECIRTDKGDYFMGLSEYKRLCERTINLYKAKPGTSTHEICELIEEQFKVTGVNEVYIKDNYSPFEERMGFRLEFWCNGEPKRKGNLKRWGTVKLIGERTSSYPELEGCTRWEVTGFNWKFLCKLERVFLIEDVSRKIRKIELQEEEVLYSGKKVKTFEIRFETRKKPALTTLELEK